MMASPRVLWEEVTAVFGGTFDPPHAGHQAAIAGLFVRPGVGRVLVLPSGAPPLKSLSAPSRHRLRMSELCFGGESGFRFGGPVEVNDLEIARSESNPSTPTYSFDSLAELSRRIPRVAFVVGADQLQDLERWHRFPELLELCHWIVLRRRGVSSADSLATIARWQNGGLIQPDCATQDQWQIRLKSNRPPVVLRVTDTDAPELSSTQVREAIQRSGQAEEGTLWPPVARYLNDQGLYGTRTLSSKR